MDVNKKKKILNISSSIIISILSVLLLIKLNFTQVVVSGPSMQPTLTGDDVNGYEYGYTDRFLFRLTGLDRYDIVVVKTDYNDLWIKRIIGMPNETIQIIDGKVYINDKLLISDTYGVEPIIDPGIAGEKIKLGKKQYFVMGDNRNHSTDSRSEYLGVVDLKQIYGHSIISRGICKDTYCDKIYQKHDYEVKGW